jgi:hypothetical protein
MLEVNQGLHLRRLLLRPSSRVLFFWQLRWQWKHRRVPLFTPGTE